MRIAGSLWSVPPDERVASLLTAISAGLGTMHWDSTDGVFAAHGGFTPATAQSLLDEVPPVGSEAHVMMVDPSKVIDAWSEFCSLIVVPVEIPDPWQALRRIEARGVRAGLAVSLDTDLGRVPHADLPVLVMAITPGRAGDPFSETAVERVQALRQRGCHDLVGVDGGVQPNFFDALFAAGANWLVSGNSLIKSADPKGWVEGCERSFLRNGPAAAE